MAEVKAHSAAADSSRPSSSFVKRGDRQMFTVELRPGETTIVSWKKLMKDANKVNNTNNSGSTSAPEHHRSIPNPALESRIAPGHPTEIEEKDVPQPNRFSAVVEKIERLYMGNDSSDEDVLDVPDDQYDTEDSFIDDAELDEYFEVDNSAIKHDGFFVNRGKLERINGPPVLPNQEPKKRRRKDISKNLGENKDGSGSNKHVKVGKTAAGKTAVSGENHEELKLRSQLDPVVCLKASKDNLPSTVTEAKDADKQKIGVPESKNTVDKYKNASGLLDASHQKCHENSACAHSKLQPGRLASNLDGSENTSRPKEKSGIREIPDLNLSEKSENVHKKDGSSVRPKTSTLEKAIRELEKMVAESRPPTAENREADSTPQAVKRRLPREIKLKLAKVARLAVPASQGKVSKELLNRLMSILGHLMQLRTLKRNLKIMISMGLSAKQEKDVRFQQLKKEVVEIIKMQAPSLEAKQQQHAGATVDFGPEGKAINKRKFSMDITLEDKICDLYDLFVDGLDENSGPQVRKLYAELAELWPNGYMDNHGIKHAICRAKERRRALHSKHKNQEKNKMKKLLAPQQEENVQFDAGSITSQQNLQDKLGPESSSHVVGSMNKAVSTSVTVNGPKQEKAKVSSSSSLDDVKVADGVVVKKKVKRKAEPESEGNHICPEKQASLQGEERTRSLKQSAGLPLKSNLQPTSIPGPEHSS
ncbi:PREDICTED: ubinuclein-1-like isoform X2 [Lupinus angustifolius]|uniref:ubinuclein-1-like isoform X2 n=1 Tax=Lupinus angustifolius TaxID=3871 RepID=UPI00092EEFB3|nr:PREDICTED: ubinuclein-1-like isoform X2 [Lupinus angustifolius]